MIIMTDLWRVVLVERMVGEPVDTLVLDVDMKAVDMSMYNAVPCYLIGLPLPHYAFLFAIVLSKS